jgi:purine-cytosine permease-like protein
MDMPMSLPVLLISMLLFLVLFFGIGFLLNMLLRMSWIMAIIYPIVCVFIIDEVRFIDYFRSPGSSFGALGDKITSLAVADILILASGLLGAILSGIVIKMLRNRGYQMF